MLVVKALDYAGAVLALPDKADVICCIDCLRQQFGTVDHALTGLGCQRPLLASGEDKAISGLGLCPQLALTKYVAVALIVVGGNTGAEPVHFVVATEGPVVQLAFSQQCQTGLTTATIEVADFGVICAFIRDRGKRSVDVSSEGTIVIDGRGFNEAAGWRERDPFEMQHVGILDLLFDLC